MAPQPNDPNDPMFGPDGQPMFFDRRGRPISLVTWGRKFKLYRYKVIKQTTLWWGAWVSTVWLGANHGFSDKRPLIFETMVFRSRRNLDELDVVRYATEQEARRGHAAMVRRWQGRYVDAWLNGWLEPLTEASNNGTALSE